MAIWDSLKITRKTFLNPAGWFDLNSISNLSQMIYNMLRGTFITQTPIRKETYEEARERQNLTKTELQKMGQNYRQFALLFLMLGIITFIYTCYLLFVHLTFLGFLLGTATTLLFLSQAFRYDFWSLQIRRQTLGLTFNDWKESYFRKRNP